MPRSLSADFLTAIQSTVLYPVVFVQIGFSTGVEYLWSGIGTITFNGQTWTGIGTLLDISVIEDGSTVEAKGISITVSGLDSSTLSNVLNQYKLGQQVTVYLGFFYNASPWQLISSPVTAWQGRTDQPTV